MTDITRRRLLSAAGFTAGAAAVAALRGVTELHAEEALIRATHFGGPYQVLNDIVGKRFTAAGLGRVEYDVEVSPSVIAKLQTQRGNPPFDVAMVSRSFGLRALNAGLLEKVSAADFSEARALIPEAIPAAGWGVAMISDTFDMMIDTNQVKEPVTSWLDLWKPEFKGRTALPSAANGGATFAFITCIVRAIGGKDQSDAAVDEAFARLKALKPSVRTFYPDSIQPTQLIDRGDISIAPQFGIRIANQTKVSPNIVKTTPKEGIAAIPYDLCITRGTKNLDLAKQYINLTLTKPVQEQLVATLYGTPSRTDITVAPELAKLVSLDSAQLFFQDEEYAASKQRQWLDRYTREVQS